MQSRVGLVKECLAPHAVRRWATEAPDNVALQSVGGEVLTYGQLDVEARRWAAAFLRRGINPGDHVITFLPKSRAAFAAWLGLGWIRGVEVPLNAVLNGDLLQSAVSRSGARHAIVGVDLLDAFEDALAHIDHRIEIDIVERDGNAGFLGEPSHIDTLEGPSYRDINAVLYTSGTTGVSKGVLVPWATVYQTWSWVPDEALGIGDGVYSAFALFHNSGRAVFNAAMARGARLVWRDQFRADDFWQDIKRSDCCAATLVGPMTAYLAAHTRDEDARDSPLRAVLCGPMIPDIEAFERRFGIRVATCYSSTEVGTALATDWNHGPWTTCGRPRTDYPWTEVRVVNQYDEPVGPGEIGELIVRSAEPWALAPGYYAMAEATAAAWRNGWFHTGDAFRVDPDGWYHLVDRLTDTIRRRGENISSTELESVVGQHPEVIECAAIGVPSPYGEQDVLVVIAVEAPAAFDARALIAWLGPRLPGFMVPRYIRAVPALPRNATTLRVQKHRLREVGAAGAWDREPPP